MLSHHLVQLYWWGMLDLTESSVLSDFLATASDGALKSMIVYVGRSLSETQEPVAEEIVARLQMLWDYILTSDNARKDSKVFANFGWWFNTSYFDDAWALDRLHSSLVLAGAAMNPLSKRCHGFRGWLKFIQALFSIARGSSCSRNANTWTCGLSI